MKTIVFVLAIIGLAISLRLNHDLSSSLPVFRVIFSKIFMKRMQLLLLICNMPQPPLTLIPTPTPALPTYLPSKINIWLDYLKDQQLTTTMQ